MVSSSKSAQSTTTQTTDNRMISDNGATSINSGGGGVAINYVPDEAFQLAQTALANMAGASDTAVNATTDFANNALSSAVHAIQQSAQDSLAMARTESAQLGDKIVKIGIPAAVIVFLVSKMK
ncbi:hypothetical protein [Thioclava nitratireducens]|uniref:hypothetical protein n=1 Tax=Thioclava nitratireducens TaxID=1915078 RepID=UPI002481297F|nr:hypothetical protein [Thioclava nitratireducens]WGT50152.1 hypothetical protein P0N61_17900 [Thioclava nitratireducens]